MKLRKEQKTLLEDRLNSPWGHIKLQCDGYQIDLQVQRVTGSSIRYRVMTYVNGVFEYKWCSGRDEHPEQKFLRKFTRSLCSRAERERAIKALGKRYVEKQSFYNATMTFYAPDWASGKAAINHLCRVCESVEVISD